MTTNSPTEQEGAGSRSNGLSHDAVFTLSHHRRRAILDSLLTQNRALTLRDLQNEIVRKEDGMEITERDGNQAKRTLLALHHAHIPALAEAGFVTYDRDRNIVEPTEKIAELEPFLSCISEISR